MLFQKNIIQDCWLDLSHKTVKEKWKLVELAIGLKKIGNIFKYEINILNYKINILNYKINILNYKIFISKKYIFYFLTFEQTNFLFSILHF